MSPLAFYAGVFMLAVAAAGMFALARSAPETRAMNADATCTTALSLATRPAPPGTACEILGGTIARARKIARGYAVTFSTSDGRLVTMLLPGSTSPEEFEKLSYDVGTHAVLETVSGVPAFFATRSRTFALDANAHVTHEIGVVLLAVALAYFAAMLAIAIMRKRTRR